MPGDEYWLTNLNNGTYTRADVVYRKLKSQEYISALMDQGFQLILKRSISPVSTNDWWYQQLSSGAVNEASFLMGLIFSQEYRERAKAIGVQRRYNSCTLTSCNAFPNVNFCNSNPSLTCPSSTASCSVQAAPVTYTQLGYKFTNAGTGVGTVTLREELDEIAATSVQEETATLSPNPFSEHLVVDVPGTEEAEIHLYNELGQEQAIGDNHVQDKKTFSTSHLPAGMYVMRVVINGQSKIKQLIKN